MVPTTTNGITNITTFFASNPDFAPSLKRLQIAVIDELAASSETAINANEYEVNSPFENNLEMIHTVFPDFIKQILWL